MAFSKLPATVGPPATPELVVFTFEKDKLFDKVSLQTNYMTKQMVSKDGANIGEEYALSEDERDAFELSLEVVMSEIFEIFLKQTTGIQNAYLIEGDNVSISIFDNNAYNNNVLTLVDMAIRDSIIAGSLKGWFETCSQSELFAISNSKYIMTKELLKRRLFQLKKRRAFAL